MRARFSHINSNLFCIFVSHFLTNNLFFIVQECTKCRVDYYHEGSICLDECSPGHFLTDDTCLSCPDNCSECWEREECTECVSGKFLHGSQCIDECLKGYTGTQGICIPCHTGCDICDAETQKGIGQPNELLSVYQVWHHCTLINSTIYYSRYVITNNMISRS